MSKINVSTKFGIVKNVPLPNWTEIIPYWPRISKAFFEVLIENDFNAYTATIKRPTGFVADLKYWEISEKGPKKLHLKEASVFIRKIKEKTDFVEAIKEFNAKGKVDWLRDDNIHLLGGYIYSFYYTLKPVLRTTKKSGKIIIKPILSSQKRINGSEQENLL